MTDTCPITAKQFCEVAEGDAADIDKAVAAANDALHGEWATMAPAKRARILWKMADELEARMFQHEIDHLNGVLMFDRVDGDQRKGALAEYRRIEEQAAAERDDEARGGIMRRLRLS